MISSITGNVIFTGERFAVINVGGVGYKVFVSPDTLHHMQKVDGDVSVWTYLAVREQSLDLYGFLDFAEQELFEMLINVSGIGPKSGLAILGVASVETLTDAIINGDTSYLTKVSGVGKKSAEKIILELKDSLIALPVKEGSENTGRKEESDAIDALVALGYSANEAREALKKVSDDIVGTAKRITEALKIIGEK